MRAPARPERLLSLLAASWERSRQYGVDCALVDVPYTEPSLDVPLVRAALPVVEALLDRLATEPASMMVTDRDGVVLVRRVSHEDMTSRLDRVRLTPGHVFSERSIGTNGIGTALASGQAVMVTGRQHHVEALQVFRCAAVPILHPTRRHVLGAVNVTTTAEASGGMLEALTHLLSAQIESQLAAMGSRRERALFQDYMQACASVRPGAVMALNRDIVMMNDQLRAAITGVDHDTVLEHAKEVAEDVRFEGTRTIALPSGRVADLRVSRSSRDDQDAGAVVKVRLVGRAQPASAAQSRPSALGLVGSSPHWLRAVAQAREAFAAGLSVCLVGEAGAGKTSLVDALLRERGAGHRLRVVELPAAPSGVGAHQWLQDLEGRLSEPAQVLLLRDAHRLPRPLQGAVSQLLSAAGSRTPQLVLTRQGALTGVDDHLDRHFEVRIEVPPVRHRPDDIEQLVRYFLRRYHPGGDTPVTAAAMVALQQCLWPENVRQIESVVRELARRPGRLIDKDDLPSECRVASRCVLTPIEALERDAILRALVDTDVNVQRAARALGISRATIYRKMRRYGIDPATLT